jgi:hypothetical protein
MKTLYYFAGTSTTASPFDAATAVIAMETASRPGNAHSARAARFDAATAVIAMETPQSHALHVFLNPGFDAATAVIAMETTAGNCARQANITSCFDAATAVIAMETLQPPRQRLIP